MSGKRGCIDLEFSQPAVFAQKHQKAGGGQQFQKITYQIQNDHLSDTE